MRGERSVKKPEAMEGDARQSKRRRERGRAGDRGECAGEGRSSERKKGDKQRLEMRKPGERTVGHKVNSRRRKGEESRPEG